MCFTFAYCASLTSIIIPNSVINIEDYAFGFCGNLTSVTITNLNPAPIAINLSTFMEVNLKKCLLRVPTSAVSIYQNTFVWKEFNIVGDGFLVNSVTSDNKQGYTIGDGLYGGRATATVEAVAHKNYHFVNWTKNGAEVSKDNPYTFTVTEDVELVANFAEGETGIVETDNYPSLRVYPNPTDGILHVETQCIASLQDVEMQVFDIMGRLVGTNLRVRPINNTETSIDISYLPSGIYFLRIAGKMARFVKN